ncbi:MAG: winged helix-turn-helix domain-containing protein [bacterium]
MATEIGTDAGVVWQYLSKNGAGPVTKLVEATGLDKKRVDRAVGWLAREGKAEIARSGKTEVVSLLGER